MGEQEAEQLKAVKKAAYNCMRQLETAISMLGLTNEQEPDSSSTSTFGNSD
jgi:hypothetical protein